MIPQVSIITGREIILQVIPEVAVLLSALLEENVGKVSFFCVVTDGFSLLGCQIFESLCVCLLRNVFEKNLVLSGYTDSGCNIDLHVESLIPLWIGHHFLPK